MSWIHAWLSRSGSLKKEEAEEVPLLPLGDPDGQAEEAFAQSPGRGHDPAAPAGGYAARGYDEHVASPGHHRHAMSWEVQASQLVKECRRHGSQS
jgi:hypothetical protein